MARYSNSKYSNIASATTLYAYPNAPSSLSAILNNDFNVNLSWIDNAQNETGFIVERKASGFSYSELTRVASNVTGYTDSNIPVGYFWTTGQFVNLLGQTGGLLNHNKLARSSNFEFLYFVGSGEVFRSTDAGNTYIKVLDDDLWKQVTCSHSGDKVFLFGTEPSIAFPPAISSFRVANSNLQTITQWDAGNYVCQDICCNNSGNIVYAVINNSLYNFGNTGAIWPFNFIFGFLSGETVVSVDCSSNGLTTYIAASGNVYRSINSGASWIGLTPSLGITGWNNVACNNSGNIVLTTFDYNNGGGYIMGSFNSGLNWQILNANLKKWSSIDLSQNGKYMIAAASGDYIYVSSNSGVDWYPTTGIKGWTDVGISISGDKYIALNTGADNVYYSNTGIGTFFYRVKATNSRGDSSYSNEANY